MDRLLDLPILWMSLAILGAIYLFTAALYWIVTALAVGERGRAFQAISPGILPPLAVLFALLLGFLAAQVWNERERAGLAVNREASSLRAVVLLAAGFPGEPESQLRELVRRHIESAVGEEWGRMAGGTATLAIVPPRRPPVPCSSRRPS